MKLRGVFEDWQRLSGNPSAPLFWSTVAPRIITGRGLPGEDGRFRSLRRNLRALQLPETARLESSDVPEIDLFIKVGNRDLDLLPYSLHQAILMSLNPINTAFVVTDSLEDLESIRWMERRGVLGVPVRLATITDLLGHDAVELLRQEFGEQAGWVGQQISKAWFTFQSTARGVLVLDADTLLLRKRQFLDKCGAQVLMPSLEFHSPYYEVLNCIFPESVAFDNSFITHHMLIQPAIQRKIFGWIFGEEVRVTGFIRRLLGCTSVRSGSMFDVDYELYAQGMSFLFSDKVHLIKWSNRGRIRPRNLREAIPELIIVDQENYCSVSLHHYLA